jgi:hypothetical protein
LAIAWATRSFAFSSCRLANSRLPVRFSATRTVVAWPALSEMLAVPTTTTLRVLRTFERAVTATSLWRRESDPQAKRQLLALIFEHVWLYEQRVVAIQPKAPFAPFFENRGQETPASAMCKERERRDSNPRPLP